MFNKLKKAIVTEAMHEARLEEQKSWEDEELISRRGNRSTSGSTVVERILFGSVRRQRLTLLVLTISILCNVWMSTSYYGRRFNPQSVRKSLTGLSDRPLVARKEGFWDPAYSSANDTEVEKLWKTADAGFGIIALDSKWAVEQGLEDSRAWKIDRSKSVYVFTVYHAIHCVRSLRLTWKKLMNGEPLKDHWGPHGFHCFEIIREELMCSATDQLYATKLTEARTDARRIGEGETRQCSDWEYLRDWAGQYNANYIPKDESGADDAEYLATGPTTDGWYIPPALGTQNPDFEEARHF